MIFNHFLLDSTKWVWRVLIFRKKKDPVKETLYAIYHAREAGMRIELLMDKIRGRRRKLLEMAAELDARGQSYLAKKYAQEIAKLDKIYARLSDLRLVLEKISTSLEYALTIRNFKVIARDVLGITSEIRKLPETTIPDIGLSITQLEYNLRNLEDMDLGIVDIGGYDVPSSTDVEKILEEARLIVHRKLVPEVEEEANPLGNSV